MAIQHAKPLDVIDVRPLGAELPNSQTHTLVKTDELEIIRLVLPKDKEIATHTAPGQITVQCLEGRVEFSAADKTVTLEAGNMLYLNAHDPHSVRAVDDASILLTILLPQK